jgi:hypothetical protein
MVILTQKNHKAYIHPAKINTKSHFNAPERRQRKAIFHGFLSFFSRKTLPLPFYKKEVWILHR